MVLECRCCVISGAATRCGRRNMARRREPPLAPAAMRRATSKPRSLFSRCVCAHVCVHVCVRKDTHPCPPCNAPRCFETQVALLSISFCLSAYTRVCVLTCVCSCVCAHVCVRVRTGASLSLLLCMQAALLPSRGRSAHVLYEISQVLQRVLQCVLHTDITWDFTHRVLSPCATHCNTLQHTSTY